ncbi:MAG: ATP-dependent RecD-like DNA helicase [Clostridia bacterium]|nr:ATP-dependent RecD-like DNA helicase [Clostridia bacterium]NCC42445.1 ATP-dependent RecD-like DNA helicase [Clostridia bacterium]
MQDTVEGYVDHIIFRNEDNGYTVMNLMVNGSELTCVGIFEYIGDGELLELHGTYVDHSTYGQQFKVETYETKIPEDSIAIERYLGSGAIKGVGAALAARIVRRFGDDTLRIVDEEPERLSEVKGISEKKAREIAEQIAEKSEMRSAMIFLQQYGISIALGVKIYGKYGSRIYTVLKENPYQLADDIQGIGFRIADEIAGRIGIHTDSDYRIKSGLFYVLTLAAAEGHVYLPQEVLLSRTAELLGVEPAYMEKHIMDLAMDRKVVIKEVPADNPDEELKKIIYASQYYYLELDTARKLTELNIQNEESEENIRKRLEFIEKKNKLELEELQRQAVVEAVKNGLLVITGGPGTGKTTTINAIIQFFELEGMDIFLAAPTGRAAKRMTETTGYEASTIHRLLELSGMMEESAKAAHFERNEENPLEADVIIIDEMSMVDISLMHALLSAIQVGTRLILVGDVNQLPSVGPGSVLKDIIDSQRFCVVKLNKIFRQATESDIVVNAHKINAGEEVCTDNKSKDFFFLKRYDADVIIASIVYLVQKKLPPYVDAKPLEIQVLTPMRKGLLGVERLNEVLQKYLNPPDKKKREREHNGGLFREGDKVMQIRNNYQLEWEIRGKYGIPVEKGIGVFNGDMGIVEEINTFAETMTIVYEECRYVEYSFKQLEELELAYAVTIHKSQGSEYPAVILPLLGGPRMLMSRNLLYTAVTRARKCVTVVGSEATFNEMIHNKQEKGRYTSLRERIEELNG